MEYLIQVHVKQKSLPCVTTHFVVVPDLNTDTIVNKVYERFPRETIELRDYMKIKELETKED